MQDFAVWAAAVIWNWKMAATPIITLVVFLSERFFGKSIKWIYIWPVLVFGLVWSSFSVWQAARCQQGVSGSIVFMQRFELAPHVGGVLVFLSTLTGDSPTVYQNFRASVDYWGPQPSGHFENRTIQATITPIKQDYYAQASGECRAYGPGDSILGKASPAPIAAHANGNGVLLLVFHDVDKPSNIEPHTLKISFDAPDEGHAVTLGGYWAPQDNVLDRLMGLGRVVDASRCKGLSQTTD